MHARVCGLRCLESGQCSQPSRRTLLLWNWSANGAGKSDFLFLHGFFHKLMRPISHPACIRVQREHRHFCARQAHLVCEDGVHCDVRLLLQEVPVVQEDSEKDVYENAQSEHAVHDCPEAGGAQNEVREQRGSCSGSMEANNQSINCQERIKTISERTCETPIWNLNNLYGLVRESFLPDGLQEQGNARLLLVVIVSFSTSGCLLWRHCLLSPSMVNRESCSSTRRSNQLASPRNGVTPPPGRGLELAAGKERRKAKSPTLVRAAQATLTQQLESPSLTRTRAKIVCSRPPVLALQSARLPADRNLDSESSSSEPALTRTRCASAVNLINRSSLAQRGLPLKSCMGCLAAQHRYSQRGCHGAMWHRGGLVARSRPGATHLRFQQTREGHQTSI